MDPRMERMNKNKVNADLQVLCRVYHDGLPIAQLNEILTVHGFKATEEGIYCGAEGRVNEQVGERTWLAMTWFKMQSGRYEFVAHVS